MIEFSCLKGQTRANIDMDPKEHGLPFKEALEYDEQMKKALVSALQRGSAQEIRQVLDCWLHGRPEETTDVPEEKQTGPKTITRGFEPEMLLLDCSLGFTVVPARANNKSCWGMCGRTTECRVKDSDGATYYYCRTCMLDHVRDKFGSTELDPASKEDQVSPQDPQG